MRYFVLVLLISIILSQFGMSSEVKHSVKTRQYPMKWANKTSVENNFSHKLDYPRYNSIWIRLGKRTNQLGIERWKISGNIK